MRPFQPLADEVVLARVRLDAAGEAVRRAEALLDEDERERASRFLVAEPRRRFTLARAALRRCLGAALDAAPASLRFVEARHGRPELGGAHDGALAFNLAHSGDLAVIAWTRRGPLGIDVEVERPIARLDELAEEVLGAEELEGWRARPEAQRARAFLVAWTRKEALLKATGIGLSGGLRELDVRGAGPLEVALAGVALTVVDLDLEAGQAGALATAPPARALRWVDVPA